MRYCMRQFGHSTYSCVLGMVMCSFAHPCRSSVARGSSTIKRRIWRLDGPAGFPDCSQWNTLRIAWLWPRRLVIEVTLGFVIAEIDLRELFKILNFSPARVPSHKIRPSPETKENSANKVSRGD